jgi:hypothetical protein
MSTLNDYPEWREVPNFPAYQVSSYGDVKSKRRGLLLKPWSHSSGHLYVALGRGHKKQVHHIVLSAFGAPRPSGQECRHLDGNPKNNRIENLAWGTRRENVGDFAAKYNRPIKGSITFDRAREIRTALIGVRHGGRRAIAARFGTSLSLVYRIGGGRTYK